MSLKIPSSLQKVVLPGYPNGFDKDYDKKKHSGYEVLNDLSDVRIISAANTVFEGIAFEGLAGVPTPEHLDVLLKKNPDFRLDHEIPGKLNNSVLTIAIRYRSLPLFRHILDLDPSLVHRRLYDGRCTPLCSVASETNLEFAINAAKELLARGADINLANPDGDTPLSKSAFWPSIYPNLIKVTQFFLSRGAIMYQGSIEDILARSGCGENFIKWTTAKPEIIEKAYQANETLRAIQKGDTLHSNRKRSLFSWLPKVIRSEITSYL